MLITHTEGADFVTGWDTPRNPAYYTFSTWKPPVNLDEIKLPFTMIPDAEWQDAAFALIDQRVENPIAFAFIAPFWSESTLSYYPEGALLRHHWEPLCWKESTHRNYTYVQLWRKLYGDKQITKAPVDKILSMGCSVIAQSFVKRTVVPLTNVPNSQMHFLSLKRPLSKGLLTELKLKNYLRVGLTQPTQFWALGHPGAGKKESCAY